LKMEMLHLIRHFVTSATFTLLSQIEANYSSLNRYFTQYSSNHYL